MALRIRRRGSARRRFRCSKRGGRLSDRALRPDDRLTIDGSHRRMDIRAGVVKPNAEIVPTGVKVNCEKVLLGVWRNMCDNVLRGRSAKRRQHTGNEAVKILWRDVNVG
jgi:hypothetical protein